VAELSYERADHIFDPEGVCLVEDGGWITLAKLKKWVLLHFRPALSKAARNCRQSRKASAFDFLVADAVNGLQRASDIGLELLVHRVELNSWIGNKGFGP